VLAAIPAEYSGNCFLVYLLRSVKPMLGMKGEPEIENSPVDGFPGERPAKDGRAGYSSRGGCLHNPLSLAIPHQEKFIAKNVYFIDLI
jgi:hypothetical protein